MSRLLNEEQASYVKLIGDFMSKEIKPNLKDWDHDSVFPDDVYKKANELGFNLMEIPEEFGGLGLDHKTIAAIFEEMGYYDSGLALTTATTGLAWKPVLLGGTPEQKQLFADLIMNGTGYAAFALTEPGGGSDVAATKSRAYRDGDEYVINGSKCFITNGGYAGVYLCVASTDPSKGHKGLSAFIVERDRPGISIGKEEDKCGIRTTNTVDVIFDEVRVPADHLVGKEGDAFKLVMKTLDMSRPFVGIIAAGMARRALDEAIAYSKTRVVFGKPIVRNQSLQFMMADMKIKTETSYQMCMHAIDLLCQGLPYSIEAAIAKCYSTESATAVCDSAIQIMGGYGYMRDYPVEKIWRDSKIFQIFEGTNQVQRIVISGGILA